MGDEADLLRRVEPRTRQHRADAVGCRRYGGQAVGPALPEAELDGVAVFDLVARGGELSRHVVLPFAVGATLPPRRPQVQLEGVAPGDRGPGGARSDARLSLSRRW